MSKRTRSSGWRAALPVIGLLACLPVVGPAQADGSQVQAGGTVTVVVPEDDGTLETLDPTASWSTLSTSILQGLVTRSLTTYVTDAKTGERTLVPDLATDLGKHNKDFTEWSFTLRPGIRFEDGRKVTAEDVRFGILRSFDGNNGTRGGGLGGPGTEYSARNFFNGTKYDGPYSPRGTGYKAVRVKGDTITIKMARPFPEMASWASFPAISPIPRTSSPKTYGRHPLATGPYKVKEFVPGKRLVLERNPAWDAASDPTRKARPDEWVFRFGQDPATADALLLSDAFDGRRVILTRLLPQSIAEARRRLGDRVLELGTSCGNYLSLDLKALPDLDVRRAIAFAYPREQAWKAAGEEPGVTRRAGDALLPTSVAGRRDVRLAGKKHISHDPDKARALLEKAGKKPGEVRLSWVYDRSDEQARRASDLVAAAFRDAGFDAVPVPHAGGAEDVHARATAGRPGARRLLARTNLERISFCADWPSGATFLPALLRRKSPFNQSGFNEAWFDGEVARINRLDAAKGTDEWGRLDERVQEKWLPMFPTGYVTEYAAGGRGITGLAADERGTPDFRNVGVLPD